MTDALRKVWSLFTPAEQRRALLMLVMVILMAALETIGVLSIMPFLSVLARPEVIQENTWLRAAYARLRFDAPRDFILALGLASMVLVIGSSAFKTVTNHLINRFIHLQRHSISTRLMARYLRQPYEFFLARNSAELGKNVLSEVDLLVFNLIQPVAQMLAQAAVVVAMVALVVLYDPLIAIGTLVVVGGLYVVIYGLVRKRLGKIGHELVAANRERYQACNEAFGGIREVKVMHTAPAYEQRFSGAARTHARHMAASDTLSQTPLYLVEAVGYTGLIAIALVLLTRSNDIGHVLPTLGMYGFAAYRMLPAVQVIYRGLARMKFSAAALDNIHRDLQLQESEQRDAGPPIVPVQSIELSNVTYAYPSAPDKPVLANFTAVIPANTTVGIMGPSGAGKSTLMDLLLGLLPPQPGGSLKVDGMEIDSRNVADWQRSIGYVPQAIYLADASVAENIAFGVPREAIDMQAVERAARAAQIHEFVTTDLPAGYDTYVGDRGVRLSGGQRQRVGIARALYHDPPALLMDEATSALDGATEQAVNAAIQNMSGEKTIIVIAHRTASLASCQSIISLERSPVHSDN